MARFTITPWRSQADLLAVRKQLYFPDPSDSGRDERRHAVERVLAWKLRGNLPHAVESTALLVDAILHHDVPGNSIFSVRAVYSAAFTRFVTGICDIGRNKERSLEPSSMLDIARQIDMPVHFVALRHEATHEELPAVSRIVKATEEALQWLWNVYWSRLEEPESQEAAAISFQEMRAELKPILRSYKRDRLEAIRSNYQARAPANNGPREDARRCFDLAGSSPAKLEALSCVFVDEKLLCPSKRELGTTMNGAFMLWDPLLVEVSYTIEEFLVLLIKSLLRTVSNPSTVNPELDVEKEALSLWILHIVTSGFWTREMTAERHHALTRDVMTWCCMFPGHWTNFIGLKVLGSEEQDIVEDWEDIFQASQLGGSGPGGIDDSVPPTDSMAISPVHDMRVNKPGEQSGWVRAPGPMNMPIGMVAR